LAGGLFLSNVVDIDQNSQKKEGFKDYIIPPESKDCIEMIDEQSIHIFVGVYSGHRWKVLLTIKFYVAIRRIDIDC
jgi:hypothetical protein